MPAGPGIFYVFRSEEERTNFLVNCYRRRVSAPRITRSERLLNEHRALLQPLIDFLAWRGRLPSEEELDVASDLLRIFGSLKQAFRVVQRGTGVAGWDAITASRAQDTLIYLALARFEGRPSFSQLPRDLQLDVKAFFSTYVQACQKADELLFSVGRADVINEACSASPIGKQTPSALYVHESALEHLSPQLRVFEGCARSYIGRVESSNLIKLYRNEPKISYLSYPLFDPT